MICYNCGSLKFKIFTSHLKVRILNDLHLLNKIVQIQQKSLKMNTKSKPVDSLTKIKIRNFMCVLITAVLAFSCLAELNRKGPLISKEATISEEQPRFDDSMRILCLQNIKDQIKSVFEPLIPKDKDVYVTYIPEHPNIGDTLIWQMDLIFFYSS